MIKEVMRQINRIAKSEFFNSTIAFHFSYCAGSLLNDLFIYVDGRLRLSFKLHCNDYFYLIKIFSGEYSSSECVHTSRLSARSVCDILRSELTGSDTF